MLLKLFCILSVCHAVFARTQIQIGALFNNDQDENEIAFRTAVERANIHERNFEMVPIISYVDAEDSFLVEKAVCKLITQGVAAIFGPSSSTSGMVSSICSVLEIPHLIYDWIPEQTDTERIFSSMTINLYPDTVLLAKAYGDIIRSFSWRSYTVVYDSLEHLVQLQDVLQIHGPSDNPIITQQLSEGPDYRPFLKNIKTSGETWIVLHCATEKLLPILRQANELKMLGEYQSFFLAPIDTHTVELDEIQFVQANITTVRIMDPTNFDVKNVVYDWERYDKREGKVFRVLPNFVKSSMLLINDAVWTFAKGLNELGIVDNMSLPNVECRRNKAWPHGRQIYEFIKGRSEEATTGRIQFNEHGYRLAFSLTVLELSPTGFQEIAIWDPENGVGEIGGDVDYNAKRVEEKLQNKTFVITSRIGAPFLLERVPKDGEVFEGNARYEGYSLDLIDAIAKLLGFKYRFELTPDGKYGSYNKVTKQWDGLVKQLLDGNADIGICDLTITSARRKAVDFSPPFMTLGISILYAKPEIAPPDLFSFLSPFSLDVWIYMATAYLGVSLLLFGLARMAPDDWENPHPCNPDPDEVENLWTIPNTTWLTMGSIMGQGCDILPKAASTRLVTGMWWFFALMMLNSYTANLAAFLTMSRMGASIESAEDLAKQSKIKYGAVSGGSTMSFFRDSNFSTFQRMWAAMESARPSVFTKSNDEGVDRVLKGKGMYAYLMESTTLEYIIERNCELMQVGGWLDYKTYGVAMPFNSPYRKQISKAILKLGEGGQLAELKRKWWKEKHGGGKCSQASEENADTPELGVENVGGVFLVLGFGLLVSIIIGILEFLWNVRRVAIDEKVTPLEAFKLEGLFAIQFWKTTKPVRTSSSGSESNISKRSSKSLAASETKSSNTNGNQMSSALSLKSLKTDKGNKIELKNIKQNSNL